MFANLRLQLAILAARLIPVGVDAIVNQLTATVSRLERAEAALRDRAYREFALTEASYERQKALIAKQCSIRAASDARADAYVTAATRAGRVRARVADLIA
nr:hypothetical protein [uncultured Sphingomonas sp.]